MITSEVYRLVNHAWRTPMVEESRWFAHGINTLKQGVVAVVATVVIVSTPIFLVIDTLFSSLQGDSISSGLQNVLPLRAQNHCSILDFYNGARNTHGDTLEEIWALSFFRLESKHNYIQWLFPNIEGSAYNSSALQTDSGTIKAFKGSVELRGKMLKSLDVMLAFYGLKRNDAKIEIDVETFGERSKNWVQYGHNLLRITRILTALKAHGLDAEASMFFKALEEVNRQNPNKIPQSSFAIWSGLFDGEVSLASLFA